VPALSGVSLLSFALNVPGPVAVARLVAEGATAVKIEPPGGDPLTLYSRTWYDTLHAGVTIVPLDLKSGEGRAALEPLLARAGVVLTSQRPSALARLGLAPDALIARHPHLRVVTIVGDTSAPDRPGHDVTYQAEAGLLRAQLPATFLADLAGAADAVTAALLALREPAGTHRVVGLRDALAPFAAPRQNGLTGPDGRFGGADPAYGVYAAADGLVAIAALEPHFRARFYATLGLPVDAPLHDVIRARTCDNWDIFARLHDVPLSRVR
jgi:crotonobetainyl-CoA:carnitine CoA-transferase CaiB-like acyl-CoA transferase